MSPSAYAIETAALGRDYGSVRALDALDLTVERGTLVGLLGPNGAGKTTAMLLLATLLHPTRGWARVDGHDVTRERTAARRRLGLVFQDTTVDGVLTVEENLVFAGRLYGLAGAPLRRAVDAALDRSGLAARRGQIARELSGGLRRLADIARATLHSPDILLLDEPTVGLDPEHRDRMWMILDAERRERGVTILFSTHYLAEAEPADRVVLLSHGRVAGDGTPSSLRATLGDEMAEIEGRDAPGLVEALERAGVVVSSTRIDRGFRIGLRSSTDGFAELFRDPGVLTRLVLRPPTLEDVYFARTRESPDGEPPA